MLIRLFIYGVVAFALGILLATLFKMVWWVLIGATIISLLLLFFSAGKFRAESKALLLLLFLFAGMMRWQAFEILPDNDIGKYAENVPKVQLYGVVEGIPEVSNYNQDDLKVRYVLEVTSCALIEDGQKKDKDVTGKVLLTVIQDQHAQIAEAGDRVQAYGTLKQIRGFQNPGQINYVLQRKSQGVTARMFLTEEKFKINSKTIVRPWQVIVQNWRKDVKLSMEKAMPKEDVAILQAMLFGGYEGISKSVVLEFVNTGIVHILSVSGAHVTLVAGTILWLIRRTGLPYNIGAPFAILGVLIYACVAGWSPPVMRSVLMGSLMLLGLFLNRKSNIVIMFFFSILLLLALKPALLFDVSFQLSCTATAGLVFFYQKTANCLKVLPEWLVLPLAATWSAQLGALPVVVWYFNKISLVSFLANLLVMPIIDLTLILGLVAVLLPNFLQMLSHFIFMLCSLLLGFLLQVNGYLAGLFWATCYVPSFNWLWGFVYYLFLAWGYGLWRFKNMSFKDFCKKHKKASALGSLLFLVLFMIYVYYPKNCEVHIIDVGQGDAILIITPHRKAVLIDAGSGSMGEGEGFDVGERVVVPYLKHYGITELEYLIASHKHADHVGGVLAVVSDMPVRNFMYDDHASDSYYKEILRVLEKKGEAANILRTGQIMLFDGIKIEVLWAENRFLNSEQENEIPTNDDSVVLKLDCQNKTFLFTGDITAKTEELLIKNKKLQKVNVLKIAHHGAKTSTTEAFLALVKPEYAAISVGYGNRFGHPSEEVLNRLENNNVKVLRTDQNGAIVFTISESALKVKTNNDNQN